MFKSCTGFKIQALCIGSKKNMTKNRAQQEKKLRKFQEHCVQKCLFQGFDKHKKNPRTTQENQGIQVQVTTLFPCI